MLVPFILLSNKDVASNVSYKIDAVGEDIMLSNPLVKVSIIPEPDRVSLSCECKTFLLYLIGTHWTAELEGITEGSHFIEVKPEGAGGKEMKINVVGVSGNMDIDDMFDL